MATGGGKTLTFCTIVKLAHKKNTASLVVVRGVKLIQQASERLTREGVEHGIYQGQSSFGNHHLVQVCSIDTLYRRKIMPPAKLIIIDEAHQTTGNGYKWFLEQYPDAKILAVSATPHLRQGLRHIADVVVYPISINELIERGYLVPPRYFAPDEPDLKDVRVSKGEYNEKDLEMVMRKSALKGSIPEHYKKLADGRPALLFAVSVNHSKQVVEQLNAAGVPAGHVDADTPDKERYLAIGRLISGEIKVLSNVGILTTGFDCPPVSCIIMARPTLSYNLHIQMLGRGTRPHPGKENFIVIDHAGNMMRHGFIEAEPMAELDARPKRKKSDGPSEPPMVKCQECAGLYHPSLDKCPYCEAINDNKIAKIRTDKSELKEITLDSIWIYIERLMQEAKLRGFEKGWIIHTIERKFGKNILEIYKPRIFRLKKWPSKRDPTFTRTSSELSKDYLTSAWTAAFGSTISEPRDGQVAVLSGSVAQDPPTSSASHQTANSWGLK